MAERMREFKLMQLQRYHDRQLNRSAYRHEQAKLARYLERLRNRTSAGGSRWAAMRAEREHERFVRKSFRGEGDSYAQMKARQVLRKEKDEMMMKAGYIRIKRTRQRPVPKSPPKPG